VTIHRCPFCGDNELRKIILKEHLAYRYLSSEEIKNKEMLGSMTTSFGEGGGVVLWGEHVTLLGFTARPGRLKQKLKNALK
jgi:hypothetical protein